MEVLVAVQHAAKFAIGKNLAIDVCHTWTRASVLVGCHRAQNGRSSITGKLSRASAPSLESFLNWFALSMTSSTYL